MKIFKSVLVLISVFFVNSLVLAAGVDSTKELLTSKASSSKAQIDTQAISIKLLSKLGLQAEKISASNLPYLAEVITNQGLFYVSYDGKYIIQGKLFSIENGVFNLTENSLAKMRLEGVKKFDQNMITYPAKNEKHVVTVFTDITCGYCRKLHEQMQDYNDLGITVRYLAYPRAGIRDEFGNYSQSFKDLRSIWCHENPEVALTRAKSGFEVAQRTCEQPIEAEFNFGRQIGVNGTPAIIFENGMMIPGYQPPADLAQALSNL